MKQFNKTSFLGFLLVFATSFSLVAQHRFFADASESKISKDGINRVIIPLKYRVLSMDEAGMKNFLWSLPEEKTIVYNRNLAPVMELPMPDGRIAQFRVWESSIQEPALQAKFPEIRTFTGQGIDDPYATIRFDLTPRGFHAQVLTPNGTYYIDPYAMGNTGYYNSYYRLDLGARPQFACEFNNETKTEAARLLSPTAACRGTVLATYRLAVACTGEYAQAPGVAAGTNPALLHASIVTTVNRVVGVYEKEVAVRMVLVANNNLVEYLSASTDPFNGNNNAGTLINESQSVITSNIGTANFDIGHTFSTGGGGLAGLGVVCQASQKARGITGSPSPTGDAYDIDYVAHEMGHQWGGNHTFNSTGGNCNGNRNAGTAYEVGSGTTIQAYAGICSGEDIQPNSDPTFHAVSFDEISNYLAGTGGGCGVTTPTGNTLPVIDPLPASVSIPPSTPFTLTGSATDADGDALSYCWEQWDLGPAAGWNAGATAAANNTLPLFKSRLPKTTGSRTFPDPAVILAGYPANPPAVMNGLKGETLSPVARPIKFRLTVRDNRAAGGGVVSSGAGGCQSSTVLQVNVVGSTPFVVTAPNGGETWAGGSTQTITWNVAGTNAAPISAANVKISLSTDGGLTYPTVISASTANDGSESVTIPGTASTTARVKVEAIGNVFFDISNQNFTITAPVAGFTFDNVAPASVACGGPTSASITLTSASQAGFSTPINLTAAGNPAGTNVTFSTNPLTPGNSTTVTLTNTNTLAAGTYNITVTGVAGAITQTATLAFTVQAGTPPAVTTAPAAVSVCSGDLANFSVVSPTAGVTYQWQVNTGAGFNNIAGATAATYSFTTAQSDNGNQYQVIISYLCGTTTTTPVGLTVNTAANITTQPANFTACSGDDHTFSVVATGTGISYQWQVDTGTGFNNISGATSDSYTVSDVTTAQSGYQYQVVITATGSACPAPGVSDVATLTVNELPVVTATASESSVCTGTSVDLTADGAAAYTWAPGGSTSNPLTVTPEVNPSNPSVPNTITYTVTGTTDGCSSSATVDVTANPLPVVTLSATPNNTTFTVPSQTVTLTANVTPPGSSYTYEWDQNGVPVANNTNTLLVDLAHAGEYGVTVSIGGQCASASNRINVIDSVEDRFYIYPNPNDGRFVIQLKNPNNVGNVTVFDTHGKRVKSQVNIVDRLPYQVISVDLRPVSSGVYVLAIFDKAGVRLATEKIVVHPH